MIKTADAVPILEDWLKTYLSDGVYFNQEAEIFNLGHSFLIVKTEDGLTYTNQTGGSLCRHPSQRGILIELNRSVDNPELPYLEFDAKKFFEVNPHFSEFLDPNGGSEEAWIQVKLKGTDLEAVLVYENSD